MIFEQIIAKAHMCSPNDGELIRVTIAASEGNSNAATFLKDRVKKGDRKVKVIAAGSFGYYDLEP
jgi:ferredoxin-NADP reductase